MFGSGKDTIEAHLGFVASSSFYYSIGSDVCPYPSRLSGAFRGSRPFPKGVALLIASLSRGSLLAYTKRVSEEVNFLVVTDRGAQLAARNGDTCSNTKPRRTKIVTYKTDFDRFLPNGFCRHSDWILLIQCYRILLFRKSERYLITNTMKRITLERRIALYRHRVVEETTLVW